MPSEGPGSRYSCVATKASAHGAPIVEKNHAGIAAKSGQALPAYPTAANALAAQQIGIGDDVVIMLTGLHDVAISALPGGAAEGDAVYIKKSDNTLANAAAALSSGLLQATYAKLGLISAIDVSVGRASVNLNMRSAF